ncbi:MAG: RiPP maturation radical SAM C-methyltransferase [Alphaproteobacteria bacterium]|nr:RiPP maturation radical SAM C-methyltransferase [Alphaproteobacteria bacterium]
MKIDVALAAMPFAPLSTPSLGLGLLHSALAARSVTTKTFYFSFRFAQQVGAALYDQISDGDPARADLVGDWVFNGNLFDEDTLDIEGYVRDVLHGASRHHRAKRYRPGVDAEGWVAQVLEIRDKTGPFLDECVDTLLAHDPSIVGVTSMFEEHVAALALAKKIKAAREDVFVVMGGSNCEASMGLETARQFPFLDAVVSGEGDIAFPELVDRLRDGRSLTGIPGVHLRAHVDRETDVSHAPGVESMDDLPYPDFDDYFQQSQGTGFTFDEVAAPHLMFETARGCWWGQINHCTFCGLNGATIAFRSKSAARAMDELLYLIEKYPGHPVAVSDNILDHKYLKDFVPALTEKNPGVELFYEVKANLKKHEVRALREAGIKRIQPGIESFSTPILKLMRKGVSAIQNVQLLKWCRELGVTPVWGLLWGFPGEDPDEYARMAKLLPLLTHLAPPVGITQIRLDRFSPNFNNANEEGFVNVMPFPSYRYVYPLEDDALRNLAYFFTYDYADGRDVAGYTQPIVDAVEAWCEVQEKSALFYVDKDDALMIWDLRPGARSHLYALRGALRVLYVACDTACSLGQLRKTILAETGQEWDDERIEEELRPLLDCGLMIREGQLFLSLAIPTGEYALSTYAVFRFQEILQDLGEESGDDTVIRLTEPFAGTNLRVAQAVAR